MLGRNTVLCINVLPHTTCGPSRTRRFPLNIFRVTVIRGGAAIPLDEVVELRSRYFYEDPLDPLYAVTGIHKKLSVDQLRVSHEADWGSRYVLAFNPTGQLAGYLRLSVIEPGEKSQHLGIRRRALRRLEPSSVRVPDDMDRHGLPRVPRSTRQLRRWSTYEGRRGALRCGPEPRSRKRSSTCPGGHLCFPEQERALSGSAPQAGLCHNGSGADRRTPWRSRDRVGTPAAPHHSVTQML